MKIFILENVRNKILSRIRVITVLIIIFRMTSRVPFNVLKKFVAPLTSGGFSSTSSFRSFQIKFLVYLKHLMRPSKRINIQTLIIYLASFSQSFSKLNTRLVRLLCLKKRYLLCVNSTGSSFPADLPKSVPRKITTGVTDL